VKVSRPREDKNPVVIGRLGRNEKNPTVTFYGHYDVQPAMEREWVTDPFQVFSKDGYFYGRGTSDNKVIFSTKLSLFSYLQHLTQYKMWIV
jgi:acetylornithine deacetylase/succinyl-diaminopimelate desuccinylase-like protein